MKLMTRFFLPIAFILLSVSCFAQANYKVTDPEKNFKDAKDLFIKGEYTLAYPLLKSLMDKYPENTKSSHAYLNEDVEYFFIVCVLVAQSFVGIHISILPAELLLLLLVSWFQYPCRF